jgi:hypothetical protein
MFEDLTYFPHTYAVCNLLVMRINGHASTLLPSMLQGSERQGDIMPHVKPSIVLWHVYFYYSARIV